MDFVSFGFYVFLSAVLIAYYALPLGYNVSSSMGDIKFGKNPYENQNALLSSMMHDKSLQVYKDVPVVSHTLDGKGNELCELKISHTGPVYIFLDGYRIHSNRYPKNCALYLNGKLLQDTCGRFAQNSVYLGEWQAGDTIKLSVKRRTDKKKLHTLYIAQLDTQVFEAAVSKLSSGSSSTLAIRKNVISGSYTTERDSTVFLSIPYEDSWTCFTDGKKTPLKRLANTFIGIDLKAGTHNIRIVYSTPGLRAGIAMSGLGVLLSAAYFLFCSRKAWP